ARAVAFVSILHIVDGLGVAGGLLDAPLNGIVRHVIGFCLGDHVTELAVVGRVRAAFFYRYGDLTADDGKDLTFGSVVFLFFMLNVSKFGMSRHNSLLVSFYDFFSFSG